MDRYIVTMHQTILQSVQIEVWADSEADATDKAFDRVANGDVEFEFDDCFYEVADVDIDEGDA